MFKSAKTSKSQVIDSSFYQNHNYLQYSRRGFQLPIPHIKKEDNVLYNELKPAKKDNRQIS